MRRDYCSGLVIKVSILDTSPQAVYFTGLRIEGAVFRFPEGAKCRIIVSGPKTCTTSPDTQSLEHFFDRALEPSLGRAHRAGCRMFFQETDLNQMLTWGFPKVRRAILKFLILKVIVYCG